MTSAEKMRLFREKWRAKGYCARGGRSHGKAKRGAICKKCLAYDLQRKRRKTATRRAEP